MAKQTKARPLQNEWRKPDPLFDQGDSLVEQKFGRSCEITRRKWSYACRIVDTVLGVLLEESRIVASRQYEELEILQKFIRQGSARQGLKVIAPDEFDVIMPFTIKGLDPIYIAAHDNVGNKVPGLIKVGLHDTIERIKSHFPKLYRENVFVRDKDGHLILNVKELQKSVFNSVLDQALAKINSNPDIHNFSINRRVEPPTMNLRIFAKDGSLESPIDVDVIPGLLVGEDEVQIPAAITGSEEYIKFPRFAVMKWINRKDPTVPEHEKDYLWRVSSTAFERYMTDICQGNTSRMYILTACMVLKTAFINMKKTQNQVAVLYKSYYLKNICLYLILILTVLRKKELSGVREALGYFLRFIKLTLESRKLPNFFLGNRHLGRLFPDSYFTRIQRPYNMFAKANAGLVGHANYAFKRVEAELMGCYDISDIDQKHLDIFKTFL